VWLIGAVPFAVLVAASGAVGQQAGRPAASRVAEPVVPRAWDDAALTRMELPNAALGVAPQHVPAAYYYRLPVVRVYRTYPVYAPGREPKGYLASLRRRKPEVVSFDRARMKTERDWVRAGEAVFHDSAGVALPLTFVPDAAFIREAGIPVARDGTLPFFRYVIRERGKVEFADFSCANCHTRVMPDGDVVKGAQGNFPWDRYYVRRRRKAGLHEKQLRGDDRFTFAAPWLGDKDPSTLLAAHPVGRVEAGRSAIPPGVVARHGASALAPVKVPDLIGVRDRRYLDATGLLRQDSVADLMRYAAFNTGLDFGSEYPVPDSKTGTGGRGGFIPLTVLTGEKGLPADPAQFGPRYSDEQLYALARYLYALRPPANPNPKGAAARRGAAVFGRSGCVSCHPAPLYTNNKLAPAPGFTPPDGHPAARDILPSTVGTDPALALYTRRGTGLYKVPSLRGVWYRGMFGHDGACATLEDWFDPRRLRPDYVPTGFKGFGVERRAVPGHEFGLDLTAREKADLIAFLRTL
jgi:mono/diheme cytochrome c family protein